MPTSSALFCRLRKINIVVISVIMIFIIVMVIVIVFEVQFQEGVLQRT